jgi:hypothetical protein
VVALADGQYTDSVADAEDDAWFKLSELVVVA